MRVAVLMLATCLLTRRSEVILDIPGCIPTTLTGELDLASQDAPVETELDAGCTFWRSFLQAFTRGDIVAMAHTIFHDLSEMSDSDETKSNAYKSLEHSLEEMEHKIGLVFHQAMDADPRGQGGAYHFASHLNKKVEHISMVICELIYLRRDGLDCLLRNVRKGSLVYKLM